MSIKDKLKRLILFLLHGESQPIIAKITYLNPNEQLKGKKIIITGGGRGIGYFMAKRFVAEGAEVLIAGRNEECLKNSATQIGCKYLKLNVQDIDSFEAFIKEADEIMNGINVLVNNAGVSLHEKGFLEVTTESFDSQFNTNLKGAFFLTQSFIKYCNEHQIEGFKKILFISSETGTTVDERPYGLTKIAINSLVQGLAYKYVNDEFRINAIAPGVTISDMTGIKDDGTLGHGNKRYFKPEEMAEIATFLVSDISNCITGQILMCNEGRTINARWR